MLSTHAQDQASGVHLDAAPAKQQLESNLNNAKALSEVAKNQQTDPLEVLDQLVSFIENLAQQDPKQATEFKTAVMLLASPSSIALSSNQDIHLSADGQISQQAGDSINVSTQKSLLAHASSKISLFAQNEGLRIVAAQAKLEMQAQGDGADVIARQKIQITSTEDTIYISSPKGIHLTGETSKVSIDGAGIRCITNQKFESKAGQHKFESGEKVEVPPIKFNSTPCYLTFEIVDIEGKPAKNIEYIIFKPDGSQKIARTDSSGRTERFETDAPESISIHISDKNASKYKIIS